MADGVKMAYARDKEKGTYVHVSQKVGSRELICPECGEPVYPKTGKIRRHHFAHFSNTQCTISFETNLHLGAKIFLLTQLQTGQEADILIRQDLLPPGVLKEVLGKARIPRFQVPLHVLIENVMCRHEMEKGVGGLIFDVLTTDHQGPRMAWEICVSHPITLEKLEYFNKNSIPFIELEPTEKGQAEYTFEVRQLGNTKLVDPQDLTLKSLFHLFADEFQRRFAPKVLEGFLDNAGEILTDYIFADVDGKTNPKVPGVSLLERTQQFLETSGRFYAEQSIKKNLKGDRRDEVVGAIDLEQTKFGPSIRFNKKAYIDSPLNLAGQFLKVVGDACQLMGDVNDQNEIVGLRMEFFGKDFQEHRVSVKLPEPGTWKGMVNLSFLDFTFLDGKPVWRFLVPDAPEVSADFEAILTSPSELFFLLLTELRKHAVIKVTMEAGAKGFPLVCGLEVRGIYSAKTFNQCLLHGALDHIRSVLFTGKN